MTCLALSSSVENFNSSRFLKRLSPWAPILTHSITPILISFHLPYNCVIVQHFIISVMYNPEFVHGALKFHKNLIFQYFLLPGILLFRTVFMTRRQTSERCVYYKLKSTCILNVVYKPGLGTSPVAVNNLHFFTDGNKLLQLFVFCRMQQSANCTLPLSLIHI